MSFLKNFYNWRKKLGKFLWKKNNIFFENLKYRIIRVKVSRVFHLLGSELNCRLFKGRFKLVFDSLKTFKKGVHQSLMGSWRLFFKWVFWWDSFKRKSIRSSVPSNDKQIKFNFYWVTIYFKKLFMWTKCVCNRVIKSHAMLKVNQGKSFW